MHVAWLCFIADVRKAVPTEGEIVNTANDSTSIWGPDVGTSEGVLKGNRYYE